MYGSSHNPYKYEIKIYNADQISDLFHNNQQQMNKVKDIMLYYDEVYSLKREGTSTYTVYDKDLKTIKNYLSDYNFCILTDFIKNTGVCRVARRYDVFSFLFALEKNNGHDRHCNIYYLSNQDDVVYYGQWYDEFGKITDNWYYGIKTELF